jgi:hypothetical protein
VINDAISFLHQKFMFICLNIIKSVFFCAKNSFISNTVKMDLLKVKKFHV